jgi:dihydrofolate reductase
VPLTLVAAVARDGVIGREGRLPWRLPADLARFKRLTMGHPLIVGRKTWQSIGRALPGRRMIVLTRDPLFRAPGAVVAGSVEEALREAGPGEAFVAGGQAVYEAFLPLADTLALTHVDGEFPGDARFPPIPPEEWTAVSSEEGTVDAANPHPHRFVTYRRVRR